MRVALFCATADVTNGYGNITYELTRHLSGLGVEVVLFAVASEEQLVADLHLPFETRCVLPNNALRLYLNEGRKLFRSYDVSDCDIVHSLFAFPYCIPAARSAKKYGKPFMMGAQGTYGVRPLTQLPERWFLKRCYSFAKAIVVPSAFTQEKITEHAGCEYPISIIHNGVDVDRFQKDVPDIRSQYAGKKVLLTVGGLKERKGQDIVIRALQKIRQQREDVVYVLVGEGNWKPGLQKLAEELGVADAVDFVGSKKGDELVSLYNACDVYVHTPKVVDLNFEGFGIVYLEASACGKPIVATDAGGIRDAVVDGKTGLIAPDGDVDAVAKHILSLVDSPELALQMGEAGKVYARAHDWSDIAKQYLDHYNQIHP